MLAVMDKGSITQQVSAAELSQNNPSIRCSLVDGQVYWGRDAHKEDAQCGSCLQLNKLHADCRLRCAGLWTTYNQNMKAAATIAVTIREPKRRRPALWECKARPSSRDWWERR